MIFESRALTFFPPPCNPAFHHHINHPGHLHYFFLISNMTSKPSIEVISKSLVRSVSTSYGSVGLKHKLLPCHCPATAFWPPDCLFVFKESPVEMEVTLQSSSPLGFS